jgi:iron(III) transport system ATP-binding protein
MPCCASSIDSVDLIGVQLTCQCDSELVGKKAVVAIRPEDITIRDVTADMANTFDVIVDEIEFIGSFARVGLNHGRGMSITAEFSMNVMRDLDISVGKGVKICMPVEHLRIFPEQK